MLIQELTKKGVLDKEKATSLEYEVKTSGKTEEEIILREKILSEKELFELKSKKLKIPLKKFFPEDISLELLGFIPENSAECYKMVPLSKEGGVLEVGMVYPQNLKAREAMKFIGRQGRFSYEIVLITISDYEKVFRKYRNMKKEVGRALEELKVEMKRDREIRSGILQPAEWKRLAEEAPISKIVAVLLRHAVEGNASDIHIEAISDRLRVRFRVLGNLYSSIFLPIGYLSAVVARIKILSDLRIDETRIPQDGRFSTKIGNRNIDFRVSTLPTTSGEKVALRILDPQKGLKELGQLGILEHDLQIIREAIGKASGMILATGPTGSGKTTTLYSILKILNKEKTNIVTLEDPVEYFVEGLNQSQVQPEIGYTFATGLRSILRQDPDVIMVGEMRDAESAKLGINAALTGHLVLSTLHTLNVFGVIPRLINLDVEPYLIPAAFSVAVSQRLVRQLCGNCKKKVEATGKIKELIANELKGMPEKIKKDMEISKTIYTWKAVGCKKCNNLGYLERIGVFEVLKMTDSLEELILKRPSEVEIANEAKKQGAIVMRQSAILKALQGVTTIEEALRVTQE